MRQVDEDTQLVHDLHGVEPEVAQPVVDAFVAPVAQQVALVVSDLNDPDAQVVEEQ